MSEAEELGLDARNATHRRILGRALAINLAQAAAAILVGFFASSTGLLGVGLDNASDAGVYGLSLYAVGRSVAAQVRTARISALLLALMALALIVEVVRRFVIGSDPIGPLMIGAAIVNAGVNLVVMRMLRAHRGAGAHFNASWVFTGNDMVANLGIAVSGIAVIVFRSALPDLIIGVLVALAVSKGAWEIWQDTRARDAE